MKNIKEKIKNFWLEVRYHKWVFRFMPVKQRFHYTKKHIFRRQCGRRDDCLGDASVKLLIKPNPSHMSSYGFYCEKCYNDSQEALKRYFEEFPEHPSPEPSEDLEADKPTENRIHRRQGKTKES